MKNENQKILIGVITAQASDIEQRQILCGIIEQAELLGVEISVFSNIYNCAEYHAEIEVENKIYDLILSERLDGLILTAESIINPILQQRIFDLIVKRNDIPVVITSAEFPEFTCINNDVKADAEEIINHLIEVHNFRDIDFLTGPKKKSTSHKRVDGYKKALISHNIPIDESKIIFGDFWMSSGEELAMQYINGKRRLPEAIACANDYMAYGLCDKLMENGISIPHDVTVIGYEYIGERFYHYPILTTYQRNRKQIGAEALNNLYGKIKKINIESKPISGFIVKGESCSCGVNQAQLCEELSKVRREQFYSKLNLVGNFEQQLTVCNSINDYINVLQQFTYLIRDVVGVYLCLYENWCAAKKDKKTDDDSLSDAMICYKVISPTECRVESVPYKKMELFSDIIVNFSKTSVLYFCPIFFAGKDFGYFILQYKNADDYDIIFRDWLKIASNALDHIRMKNDINTLLKCQNLSDFHDTATGLYTERGLKNKLQIATEKSSENDKLILLILKFGILNDNIKTDSKNGPEQINHEIAESLKSIATNKYEFCAKISDKLYAFAGIDNYSDEYCNIITDKLQTLIEHSPLYSKNYGTHSIMISAQFFNPTSFNLEKNLKTLHDQINIKIYESALKYKNSNYNGYAKLREQIYLEPQKKWEIHHICCKLQHSAGYFRATYKELFGISFHQDLIQSRISLAKYFLLTTTLSLSAIAVKCGYDDDKYFFRQFKQITSMTPNQYKHYSSMK